MESCIVCCKTNIDIFSRITTASNKWEKCNIQRIIEKHLWWWYLRPPCNNGLVQWICCQCWHEISSFHNFYMKVEKEHKLCDVLLSSVRDDKDEDAVATIKKEEQHLDNGKMSIVEVKHESGVNSTTDPAIAEISVNINNDEIGAIDWATCFINESDSNAHENFIKIENEENNLLSNKNIKRKIRSKSNTVGKYRKKYTKTKKEKQNKGIMKNAKSNVTLTMKKNDEFIANIQYQLSCSICSVSLSNFNTLKNHFRKEHNVLGYAMCCNKKFYKRGVLIDHLNVHKDPEYFKCLQCNKPLSTRRSYEKHMETHQLYESQQNLFTCDKCEKSFLKKPVFDRHILTHVPEEERNYQCSMCDKKFASEYLRKQHCTLTHAKKYAKICDICGKQIRDSLSFIRHMAAHNGETVAKVKCDICGAELTNKYRLNRHKKMMHTEENQQEQTCPYCSKVSPNLNAHRHHVKYTHTLERKHACNMCDKKFRRPLELKEHLSTHTGEPLYTCPHCPRTFISSANMHKHRKLTHRKEWEEGRIKKEAKALAVKKFLKRLDGPTNETLYSELTVINDENQSEPNLNVLNFLK